MRTLWEQQTWRRRGFWLYAALLFTSTHWPHLRLPGPEIRTDLIMHFGAFGAWAIACAAAGWVGRWGTAKNLWWNLPIGFAYAGFDEGLQAIPALGRTCAWDDFIANCVGIVIGTVITLVAARCKLLPRE